MLDWQTKTAAIFSEGTKMTSLPMSFFLVGIVGSFFLRTLKKLYSPRKKLVFHIFSATMVNFIWCHERK